jgi:hypothetical protein
MLQALWWAPPDFLLSLVALSSLMRLSLLKAALVDASSSGPNLIAVKNLN